ncbi:MAG TPA: hypothetical protein PKI03_27655, partial [Pseudomonadota bacterium]|nr:hypothetical protein [Pseudomonadota bacterium]
MQGRRFAVGVTPLKSRESDSEIPRWAVLGLDGSAVFLAPPDDEAESGALFTVARRFVELEDAYQRGIEPNEHTVEARRTFRDSLREWGLMDEQGRVLKAFEYDP